MTQIMSFGFLQNFRFTTHFPRSNEVELIFPTMRFDMVTYLIISYINQHFINILIRIRISLLMTSMESIVQIDDWRIACFDLNWWKRALADLRPGILARDGTSDRAIAELTAFGACDGLFCPSPRVKSVSYAEVFNFWQRDFDLTTKGHAGV